MNFSDPFRRILETRKSQLCSPAERCAASCGPPRLRLVRGRQAGQLDPELGQLARSGEIGAANNKHSPDRSISAARLEKRNFHTGRNERLLTHIVSSILYREGPEFVSCSARPADDFIKGKQAMYVKLRRQIACLHILTIRRHRCNLAFRPG